MHHEPEPPREGRAEGWALDSVNPDHKLKVEIWADDEFVAIGDDYMEDGIPHVEMLRRGPA